MRIDLLRCFQKHSSNTSCSSRPREINPVSRGSKEYYRARGEEGFSVLEAMVAMAVLAAGLLPLLALQGQFVKTVGQIEHVEHSLSAQDNALNLVKSVNLTEAPLGEMVFEGYSVNYEAKAAISPRAVRDIGGLPGRFDLTLYDVEINIAYVSGRKETFGVRQFGWRATKSYLGGI